MSESEVRGRVEVDTKNSLLLISPLLSPFEEVLIDRKQISRVYSGESEEIVRIDVTLVNTQGKPSHTLYFDTDMLTIGDFDLFKNPITLTEAQATTLAYFLLMLPRGVVTSTSRLELEKVLETATKNAEGKAAYYSALHGGRSSPTSPRSKSKAKAQSKRASPRRSPQLKVKCSPQRSPKAKAKAKATRSS